MESSPRETVCKYLDDRSIPYHRKDHQPITTVAEGKLIAEEQGAVCCKTLLLKSKKGFYLLMLPADKRLVSKVLASKLGSGHLSFADADDLKAKLNTFPGAVSPMGLIFNQEKDVQLLIDREITEAAYIDCHPCTNDCSLKISVKDLTELFFPSLGVAPTVVML